MAEGTPTGWLPPSAPGAGPRPRYDGPSEPELRPPPRREHEPPPAFARPAPARAEAEPPPTFAQRAPVRGERNRAASWGLALGITGLVLLVISFGSLFMIALPCSAAGWALARRARAELAAGGSRRGEGQATAALWVGRIGVMAGVVAAVVFIVLIATGFDFDQFRDDLQRELDRRRREQEGGDAGNVRTALDQLRAAWASWAPR
jgi:hypothetical protein